MSQQILPYCHENLKRFIPLLTHSLQSLFITLIVTKGDLLILIEIQTFVRTFIYSIPNSIPSQWENAIRSETTSSGK